MKRVVRACLFALATLALAVVISEVDTLERRLAGAFVRLAAACHETPHVSSLSKATA